MSARVIQDRVGILTRSDGRFYFQRFQIKDGNLGGSAFTDKTNAEVGSYCDAMYAGSVGNFPYDGSALRIQHRHMRGARNVNAVSIRIDGHIVPAAATFKRNFLYDFEFAAVITGAQGAGC